MLLPGFVPRTMVYGGTLNKEQDHEDLDGRKRDKLAHPAIEHPSGIHDKTDPRHGYSLRIQGEGQY